MLPTQPNPKKSIVKQADEIDKEAPPDEED